MLAKREAALVSSQSTPEKEQAKKVRLMAAKEKPVGETQAECV